MGQVIDNIAFLKEQIAGPRDASGCIAKLTYRSFIGGFPLNPTKNNKL